MDARVVKKELLSENTEKMNVIKKKQKISVFCFKICLILVYLLVWLEKKKN